MSDMTLNAWMRIGQPLEPVLDDAQRCLDAWEAGGVRGLVVGRLLFADTSGQSTIPAFPGNPEAYRRRGMDVQSTHATNAKRHEQLLDPPSPIKVTQFPGERMGRRWYPNGLRHPSG